MKQHIFEVLAAGNRDFYDYTINWLHGAAQHAPAGSKAAEENEGDFGLPVGVLDAVGHAGSSASMVATFPPPSI